MPVSAVQRVASGAATCYERLFVALAPHHPTTQSVHTTVAGSRVCVCCIVERTITYSNTFCSLHITASDKSPLVNRRHVVSANKDFFTPFSGASYFVQVLHKTTTNGLLSFCRGGGCEDLRPRSDGCLGYIYIIRVVPKRSGAGPRLQTGFGVASNHWGSQGQQQYPGR